ncbi:CapA family protein [Anaeromicrobium sediminis]|uniref:CapA family protein n=1 Tax=Anaeromicrobium sediminis TaxID=1478221 RepID=UPI001FA8ABA6|nr:CapA family protein [Anaeromicrobium sediminis]
MFKRILGIILLIIFITPNFSYGEEKFVINFMGDCTLGYDTNFSYYNSFPHMLDRVNNDYGYFFKNVEDILDKDNLSIVNLEGTFTESKKRAQKKFCFKGKDEYVDILKRASIEVVNLSNNHTYDFGRVGFEDTVKVLNDNGITYYGNDYIASCYKDEVSIGILGYKGWSLNIKNQMIEDVKSLKRENDIVIVTFHWGNEGTNYPNKIQKELGRLAIDNGADIVVGHHPHVIQGIERYKDRYIVYSLGNFVFGGNRNPRDKDTFIFQSIFTIKDKKLYCDGKIIPCRISSTDEYNDYCPVIAKGHEKDRILNRIFKYSESLEYGIKRDFIGN